jgi:hypothetical protein
MNMIDLAFHLAPPVVLAWLTIVFIRRSVYQEFPLFFAYILYVPIATALRVCVTGKPSTYFWLYWSTELIYGIAEVLVIREVFNRIFSFSHEPHRLARRVFPITVVVILSITLWQTVFHPLRHRMPWEVSAIYWFDLGVHLLEGIILFLLPFLAWFFPLNWRRYEFGVLLGFGIAASATLFSYLPRFAGGPQYELFFRYGPPVGYILATLIWLLAFLQAPEKQPKMRMGLDDNLGQLRHGTRFVRKLGRWPWRKRFLIVDSV